MSLPEISVVAERFSDRHVVELDVRSAALGRTVSARLLTPSGWTPNVGRTWPTLYLLHGGDATFSCWTDHTDIADRARAAGVLVVLPEGGRAGFYTDWRAPDKHGTIPHWERFHLVELRNLVEQRYGGGAPRAVAGVSMGGYGAVMYAVRNPGLFAAVASYSGMLHVTRPGMPTLLRYYLHTVDERSAALWGARLHSSVRRSGGDPCRVADRLSGTPLYLSAGDGNRMPGDEPAPGDRLLERLIGPTSRDLAKRLAALGIPVTTSFGTGAHFWPAWRRELDRSWPFLTAALGIVTR